MVAKDTKDLLWLALAMLVGLRVMLVSVTGNVTQGQFGRVCISVSV